MNKTEAIEFLKDKNSSFSINNSNASFSSVNKSNLVYWFTIPIKKFNKDLNIICYNQNELIHINIPSNTIKNPSDLFRYREDRGAVNIEIPIKGEEGFLQDKYSQFDFTPFSEIYNLKEDEIPSQDEIPLSFWIETVEGRVKAMPRKLLKVIGANSIEEVASMHFQEYQSRLSEESKSAITEFSISRMKGFGNAYNYFKELLNKENDKTSNKYKELEDLVFHAESSFLGARYLGESIGMDKDEIQKYIPIKKFESILEEIISGDIELVPGNKDNDKAYKFIKEHRYEDAVNSALKALEQTPNHPNFLDTMAFSLYMDDKLDLALTYSNICIKASKKDGSINPVHLSTRIKIHKALGNNKEVKNDNKLLNEISPGYTDPDYIIEILKSKKPSKPVKKKAENTLNQSIENSDYQADIKPFDLALNGLMERNPKLYDFVEELCIQIEKKELSNDIEVNDFIENEFDYGMLASYDKIKVEDQELNTMMVINLISIEVDCLKDILSHFKKNKFDQYDELKQYYSVYLSINKFLQNKLNNEFDDSNKCDSCKSLIKKGQEFCGNCGNKLVVKNKCSSCGKLNNKDSRYCGNCGENLSIEENKLKPQQILFTNKTANKNQNKVSKDEMWKEARKGIYIAIAIAFVFSIILQTYQGEQNLKFVHLFVNFFVSRWYVRRKISKNEENEGLLGLGLGVSLAIYFIQIILGIIFYALILQI